MKNLKMMDLNVLELNRTFIIENIITISIIIIGLAIIAAVLTIITVLNSKRKKILINNIEDKKNNEVTYYFQLYRDKDKMFYYNLIDSNNTIVGESKKYKTKASCTNSIYMFKRIIKANVIDNSNGDYKKVFGEEIVEIIKNNKGEFNYSLISKRIGAVFTSKEFDSLDKCFDSITKINKSIHIITDYQPDNTTINDILKNGEVRQNTVNVIIKTLYEKCQREEVHSKRVSDISSKIAKEMGLNNNDIEKVKLTGLMHDIGKIIVPDEALNKKYALSDDEWEIMKRHPETGYKILASSKDFDPIAKIVLQHHERWDGTGYPRGLKGEEIDIKARIISIADSYDAMLTDRPFKSGISKKQALEEIKKNAGKQFDPKIAKIFINKVA
jgi:putative nucleotidyltransferase with HDIG domain